MRNRSVSVHQFAMTPRADIPRSTFKRESAHKTTFDSGYLVPIYLDEVLPGDSMSLKMNGIFRMATPIFPIMDNLYVETFFFFVPNRLVWDNWVRFMGEQDNPDDSTDFAIPQIKSPVGGYAPCSIYDYMGLPTQGQVGSGNQIEHSVLFLRAYNLIYNQWFRDENLQDSVLVNKSDALVGSEVEDPANYTLLRRGKRHDYFTSCLPWPSKSAEIGFGLISDTVPVFGSPNNVNLIGDVAGSGSALALTAQTVSVVPASNQFSVASGSGAAGGDNPLTATATVGSAGWNVQPGTVLEGNTAGGDSNVAFGVPTRAQILGSGQAATVSGLQATITPAQISAAGLYADLSVATQMTINQLRTSFQIQRLLERDARGGTRYTEILRSHFGVASPDARLQRPEYLGGGLSPILTTPVPQTSESVDGATPQGNLAGYTTAVLRDHSFSQSFVEHGMIIGLASIRADLTYQQGMHRMWSRKTRYDFYFPVFAALGEQAVLNREIYCDGSVLDDDVFGYQEHWGEYRYKNSQITGKFRSTTTGTLDSWHLSQRFTSVPLLNSEFISDTPPVARVVAAGDLAAGQQFICDMLFSCRSTRPMPLYSVPGLIDHF